MSDAREVIADTPTTMIVFGEKFAGSFGPELADAIIAALSAAGFAIVPKEPTHAMVRASTMTVSYTHLRAHETRSNLVCRLLLEKILRSVLVYFF